MSNPCPSGRPENPRAIIPFVNKTLTSGLPIASGSKKVNKFNISPDGFSDSRKWVRGVARLNFARAPRVGMSNPSTRRVARKIRGNHSLR